MSATGSRLKPVLMVSGLLTGIIIIAGLTLRFVYPAVTLQHVLYQARYGLLVWRLCLYTACILTGFSLYRRLPAQGRSCLIRIAGWSVILVMVNEASNLLLQGSGA